MENLCTRIEGCFGLLCTFVFSCGASTQVFFYLPGLPTARGSQVVFGLAAPDRSLTLIQLNRQPPPRPPYTRSMATPRGEHGIESRWLSSTVLPAVREIHPL